MVKGCVDPVLVHKHFSKSFWTSDCSPCRWEEKAPHERIGEPGVARDFQRSESPFGAVDGQEGDVVEGGVLDDDGGVAVARALDRHLGAEAARSPGLIVVQSCREFHGSGIDLTTVAFLAVGQFCNMMFIGTRQKMPLSKKSRHY